MTGESSGLIIFIITMMNMEVRSMAFCTGPCCDSQKREEEQFKARLGFARAEAQKRGQTVDRVVAVEPMDVALLRPVEPENIKSEDTALRCECECPCENLKTVSHPRRCAECQSGKHLRAA